VRSVGYGTCFLTSGFLQFYYIKRVGFYGYLFSMAYVCVMPNRCYGLGVSGLLLFLSFLIPFVVLETIEMDPTENG